MICLERPTEWPWIRMYAMRAATFMAGYGSVTAPSQS